MPGFDFNNTNTVPVFHGQPVGNWPMGQAATNMPRFVGNSNTMNAGTVQGQPVHNWPMGQAQANMPLGQAQASMPLGSLPQPRQGQRHPPRPISVIDASIEYFRAWGKQAEGDLPTLIYLGNQISALNNERRELLKAEKKEASRRRERETGDRLDPSPAPKRQKRATAAAAAGETSPETSSGESSHEFTLLPAATATATAMPRPEPIQQQSFTSNFMLPPSAVFINPAAAAAAATPEPIQQQSFTSNFTLPPSAVFINPAAAAATTTAAAATPEPIQQQSFTSNFMLPPSAVFINPAAAAAAAAAATITTTTAAAAAVAVAAATTPEPIQQQSFTNSGIPSPGAVLLDPDAAARTHDTANAAAFIALAPLLDVINVPEDSNKLLMLSDVIGTAEEEHPQPLDPNDSLFGEEPMNLDELFGGEGYFRTRNAVEMFPETI